MESLRERKKARTRQHISDVATGLFIARGFEVVTVAEIAHAADVSVKTVFNYFGTKEELFYDAEPAIRAVLLSTVVNRPAGTTPTEAMRPLLLRGPVLHRPMTWRDLDDDAAYEMIHGFLACEAASPTLTARRLVIGEEWCSDLAAVTGDAVWASLFTGVLGLRHRVYSGAMLERRTPRTVEKRVKAAVGEALDRIG